MAIQASRELAACAGYWRDLRIHGQVGIRFNVWF